MLHIELKEKIETTFCEANDVSVALCRDAIECRLPNGVEMTIRIAGPNEYAIGWRWGEAEMSIDTAPLHRALATYPNHLHTPDGRVVADPISEVGADPWRNVHALIDRLLAQPLLGYEPSCAREPSVAPTQPIETFE